MFHANSGCENTYDGSVSSLWKTAVHDTRDWIRLDLSVIYNIRRLKIEQHVVYGSGFKDIVFKFSNEVKINHTLNDTISYNEVTFPDNIHSTYVEIEFLNGYRKGPSSKEISSIEVFGCTAGRTSMF